MKNESRLNHLQVLLFFISLATIAFVSVLYLRNLFGIFGMQATFSEIAVLLFNPLYLLPILGSIASIYLVFKCKIQHMLIVTAVEYPLYIASLFYFENYKALGFMLGELFYTHFTQWSCLFVALSMILLIVKFILQLMISLTLTTRKSQTSIQEQL